ncbi:uncharacterized protein RCC_01425 [Ramularia collo-cygni]|uniref:Uncharacterized protein n=1 Tax=Ramularia collo-cygni TaxID=112498 RepID=A0A2D3V5L6_9PEZI|nr:uncharacterized protein RCC_01425 [Ramularia collo-cygni]CZT15573.1 uncharacterized protein RCC_01425 [Ramularia collo-cygni]
MVLPLYRAIARQSPRQFLRSHAPSRPLSYSKPLALREEKLQSPQEIEKAKQEQLKDGKKKQDLESSSETVVKAEREEVSDHDSHMEKLQKETAQQKEKEHPQGKA